MGSGDALEKTGRIEYRVYSRKVGDTRSGYRTHGGNSRRRPGRRETWTVMFVAVVVVTDMSNSSPWAQESAKMEGGQITTHVHCDSRSEDLKSRVYEWSPQLATGDQGCLSAVCTYA